MKQFFLIAFLSIATILLSCSDEERRGIGDPVADPLLRFSKEELVTFSLAGTPACTRCVEEKIAVGGTQIEVIPTDNPLNSLAAGIFEGLNPISFSSIRYRKGAELRIRGVLRSAQGLGAALFEGATVVTVPQEDNQTVGFQINFPSSLQNPP